MKIEINLFNYKVRLKPSTNSVSNDFQVGDILSVPLVGHTKHFFVYMGSGLTVGWGIQEKKLSINLEGVVEWENLKRIKNQYYWQSFLKLKPITLERRTNIDAETIRNRISKIVPGISYNLLHRNCEHFAHYITSQDIRSEQSVNHLCSSYLPFSSIPSITTLQELKSALLKCRFCGDPILNRKDFANAILVNQLQNGYYVYYLNHWSGSQQIYVTTVSKVDNFDASYN